ncbi:MAG: HYR domain-containing protein, partial [Bacteroidetes bacterium]
MKRRNTFFWCLPFIGLLLTFSMATAQTFNGNTVNTAGNSSIPSSGTGSCFSAPQTTGGTIFQASVSGLGGGDALLSMTLNLTHTWDSDLDIFLRAPNGQILHVSTDNGGSGDNYTNTVFCDNAPISIAGQSAPFTGVYRPEGTIISTTCGTNITTNVNSLAAFTNGQNGTWELVIKDDAGGDTGTMLGWSLVFGDAGCTLSGVSLPALNIAGDDPGLCGASNVSVTAPSLPCQAAMDVAVDGDYLTTVNPGQSYVIPSLASGNHTITYSIPPCGGEASQAVMVTDGVPPTLNCPGDIILNLGPGECTGIYTYNISCDDNCPFLITGNIDLPINFNNGQAGTMFNVTNLTASDMFITSVSPSLDGGTRPVAVYYTTTASTYVGNETNAAAWTQEIATTVVSTGTNPGTLIDGLNIPLAPGQSRGLYVTCTTSTGLNYTNGSITVSDANIEVSTGVGKSYPFGATFNPRSYNGSIGYAIGGECEAVQISGLAPGAEYPIGTTINVWQTEDLAGNTTTCSFSVTVNPYLNAIHSLVCNDLVQVSVDENCTAVIGADQVLEGGPYACYDDYIVELDKTAPFGNGPWVPAVVGPADIGKTYQVRVTDPDTGNKCWGNLKVEDKLAPVLDCPNYSIVC